MMPHQKPAALLSLMAERHGQRITARDVAALQLAVRTLDAQADLLQRQFEVYSETLHDLVKHKARAEALQDGLRAMLEVNL